MLNKIYVGIANDLGTKIFINKDKNKVIEQLCSYLAHNPDTKQSETIDKIELDTKFIPVDKDLIGKVECYFIYFEGSNDVDWDFFIYEQEINLTDIIQVN